MTRHIQLFAMIAAALASPGCVDHRQETAEQPACSADWYQLVEKQVGSGDGDGHGPDLGSGEWRSTIEFRLGIRDQPGIPALDTDQWCRYIDQNYIRTSGETSR